MSLAQPRQQPGPAAKAPATTAAILTWIVPGAGHMLLGRPGWALLFFVVIEGLYVAGFTLSEGLAFRYLDPELRASLLAPVLSPEAGNLGAFLYQLRDAYGDNQPVPWPEHMRLGVVLCGLSGVFNAFVMVHAHTLARMGASRIGARSKVADAGRPTLAVLLTFVLPGLGHLWTGRRLRGLVVCALLVGLFVLGTWLAAGSNLSRERHFYYWAGQFLLGLPALVAEAWGGSMRVTRDIAYADAGLVFGCVAGLLNVLVMIDAYAGAEQQVPGLIPTPPTRDGAREVDPVAPGAHP